MDKTAKEWFITLPNPYKSQAIKNTRDSKLKCMAGSLHAALYQSFTWSSPSSPPDPEKPSITWYDISELILSGELPKRLPGKFRVGDMVITQRFVGKLNGSTLSFNESTMAPLIGKSGVIRDISSKGDYVIHGWHWPSSALTLVKGDADE